jgi:calcineurin-like phosphoesterase family protein
MIIAKDLKRIWQISDIHFGVRSNSLEWLDIHKDYFYNFLIPLLENKKKPGDALFILGDIFESRQTINILILNESLKIFKRLAEIMPVYVLIGNHDCYRKSTTDVHSPIIFNLFDNIKVFNNVETIEAVNGVKLLLMPWQETSSRELDIVRNNNADYLFCHTHFGGIRFNRKVTMDDGLDIVEVAKFKKVFSGHIHYAQVLKNVRMVGCVCQLTRSDINNTKHVILYDLETEEETLYDNDYSPIFIKYSIEDILNLTHEEFQNAIKNNFIDIIIDGNWISKFPYSQLIDSVTGYTKINYILSTLQKDYESEEDNDENINLDELIQIYIKSLAYGDNMKNNLIEASDRLLKKAVKFMQEKTVDPEIND